MQPLQEKLQQIGFTEYEAKTYLALLKEYPATGYQISKNSGVPRSMVYEVLSRLHARGAVLETIEGRATYYRPLAPEILIERHQENLKALINDLKPALTQLYTTFTDDRAWSLTDQGAIYSYCQQMLTEVKKEVYLVLNDDALSQLAPTLEKLSQRSIDLNILLTGNQSLPFGSTTHHPPLESELQGLTNTLLVLADDQELLVGDISEESRATITSNKNLILIARQFVWMEFFTQRVYAKLGSDFLNLLDPEDRKIFESIEQLNHLEEKNK